MKVKILFISEEAIYAPVICNQDPIGAGDSRGLSAASDIKYLGYKGVPAVLWVGWAFDSSQSRQRSKVMSSAMF